MTIDQPVSRADLSGVWKRVLLVDEAGNEDDESKIYWVQSGGLCGDVRLHLRPSTLAGPTVPMIEAFAGRLFEGDGIFRWEAALRSRHRDGPPDEGRLSWVGAEELQEDGVHRAYRERWLRVGPASAADYALELHHPGKGQRGYVIRVGRFAFFACGPIESTPNGAAHGHDAEFSLFEMLADGPRLVLSTVAGDIATCPVVTFSATERRTIHLAGWTARADGAARPWLVTTLERPGDALEKADALSPIARPQP